MGRPRKTERTVRVTAHISEALYAQVQLELFSELEERIPFGALSEFFSSLVQDYFEQRKAARQALIDNAAVAIEEI